MKFNVPAPAPESIDTTVRVGNVYKCKGGGKTAYWIVVGLAGRSVALVGINDDGAVTSAATYAIHVFDGTFPGRALLGHCAAVESMEFDIEWLIERGQQS